jgi:transposase
MFALGNTLTYHLYRGDCDMRKSFDGLCGVVRTELGRQPASGEVFVFVNRRRTLIKLLNWQRGGFVLYYKRLESGTFPMPALAGNTTRIVWTDLALMIEGIRVEKARMYRRYEDEKNSINERRNAVFTGINP